MAKSSKKLTLRDIARLANVSAPTVSRVINDHPYVSEEKRERVLEVMREVGYRPNRVAQMLSTQRSNFIEVITVHAGHSFFRNTILDITFTARTLGYQVLFAPVPEEEFIKTLGSAAARLIDGIILIAPGWASKVTDDELRTFARGVPLALLAVEPGSTLPSVVYDQSLGAQLATQHLIDLEHQQITEITGPLNMSDALMRHQAWEQTLHQNNIEPGLSVEGRFNVKSGYESTKHLLAADNPFTALFAGNDRMALGALLALHEHGLRVPDDVSVVGFDDIEGSAYYIPPLTTVRQDLSKLGKLITELLIEQIDNPDEEYHQQVFAPELIIRSSTGFAP